MKDAYMNEIIETEWDMFQKTQNAGGRAWCQDDKVQFDANRRAQFDLWDEETLASYLGDLNAAKEEGLNPVTLKYAYMMEETAPEEYQLLKEHLPEISTEKKALIERMAEQTALWCEQFSKAYPKLSQRGRPARPIPEAPGITSAKTYCRGELSTYSMETLQKLSAIYEQYEKDGINLFERSVANEMRFLLGKSLDEMEERMG